MEHVSGNSRFRISEGDWMCSDPQCGNVNFARRDRCNRCDKEKGEAPKKKKLGHEIGKAAAEKSRGLFSADDWQCNKCGNVNWARRQSCNMCNAPKFGEVEERTGYGGGFNDRGVVEYKERRDSDDEYDEFGRRKKKKKNSEKHDEKDKTKNEKVERDDAEDEDEEEEEDEDDGDLSKYDLSGFGDEDEDSHQKDKDRILRKNNKRNRSRSRSSSPSRSRSRSNSRSRSGSVSDSRSRSPAKKR